MTSLQLLTIEYRKTVQIMSLMEIIPLTSQVTCLCFKPGLTLPYFVCCCMMNPATCGGGVQFIQKPMKKKMVAAALMAIPKQPLRSERERKIKLSVAKRILCSS